MTRDWLPGMRGAMKGKQGLYLRCICPLPQEDDPWPHALHHLDSWYLYFSLLWLRCKHPPRPLFRRRPPLVLWPSLLSTDAWRLASRVACTIRRTRPCRGPCLCRRCLMVRDGLGANKVRTCSTPARDGQQATTATASHTLHLIAHRTAHGPRWRTPEARKVSTMTARP